MIDIKKFNYGFIQYLPLLLFLIPVWMNPERGSNPEANWNFELTLSLLFLSMVAIGVTLEKFWEKKKTEGGGKNPFLTKWELVFWVGILGCVPWVMVGTLNKIIFCAVIVLHQLLRFFLFRLNQKAQKETSMKEKQVS